MNVIRDTLTLLNSITSERHLMLLNQVSSILQYASLESSLKRMPWIIVQLKNGASVHVYLATQVIISLPCAISRDQNRQSQCFDGSDHWIPPDHLS